MAYVCELGAGHRIYLEQQGKETSVLSVMSSVGQQQQSSSVLTTGAWVRPPQIIKTMQGVFIKLSTEQGNVQIQVQGQKLQISHQNLTGQKAQEFQCSEVDEMPGMKAMRPMDAMQPLNMGDMQMSFNPMKMQMGDMQMQMGSPTSRVVSNSEESSPSQLRFCTQCGEKAEAGDRFCSSCGHALRR